jgi:hypothetical protein
MKMMRVHITLWIVLLVAGFLIGFIPEYLKNRDLQDQLIPQNIDALKLQVELSEVRDSASLMLLELSRQNYGLARDYAAKYYDNLNEAIDSAQNPALKKSLQELAATHDAFNAELSAANASSLSASQPIVLKTFEVTKKKY